MAKSQQHTQEMWDALELKAKNAASDISDQLKADCMPSDDPNYEPDVGYNMYVEFLDERWYGLIDMGDLYHDAFCWHEGEWHMATVDTYELEDRILKARMNTGW